MGVKRIKPNIQSDRFDESRAFYRDVVGLEEHGGLDWILFFGTDRREVQLSVMSLDITAGVHPDISIEVDDVDAVFGRRLGRTSSTRSRTRTGDSAGSLSETRTAPSST
jgi:catechol 2,3-dioxygenase-like lactoylglutathione lyase family enzyme